MKKNKNKGFTLIELLAVIVILAIIALIATPLILNVISDAKKGSFKASAYGIIDAAEKSYALSQLSDEEITEVTYSYSDGVEQSNPSGKKLNYKGSKPQNGAIKVNTQGEVEMYLHDGTWCITKNFNQSEIMMEKKKLADCVSDIGASVYKEAILKGAIPELDAGMIPIYYDGNVAKKADLYSEWYNYSKQEWANVVLVTNASRTTYQNATPGTIITEADVLAYLVWIPRYKYKLFNVEASSVPVQQIEIEFENKTTGKSTGDTNGTYLTHPAFTFGTSEVDGIWVGKFETTGNATTPTVKPNLASLTNQNISTQFATAQKFNTTATYGLTNGDAHMMKNMEWGAVAYLTLSKYGKQGNPMYTGVNKEIYQNKDSGFITGKSNGTPSQDPTLAQCAYNDITDRGSGKGACGAGASTTGNIYGIYDMSGGAMEYVMGYNNKLPDSSGFSSLPNSKYYDTYTSNNRILGDATGEVRGWYNDEATFFALDRGYWFLRSGFYGHPELVGVAHFSYSTGAGDSLKSWRLTYLKP